LFKRSEAMIADTKSAWLDTAHVPVTPPPTVDSVYDAVIVGGGITGVTAMYLLSRAGLRVALVEADRLGGGTTGHTTAKVTAQHGPIYSELLASVGKTAARLWYEASSEALEFVADTVAASGIDCDWVRTRAILFAQTAQGRELIERERVAYEALGIPHAQVHDAVVDALGATGPGLAIADQGQFHPLRWLAALATAAQERGAHVFEQAVATELERGEHPTVVTRDGRRYVGRHVLVCSHFPFVDAFGLYFTRMKAERSYVLAVKPRAPWTGGMCLSVDLPTRSVRSAHIAGEELVLIGGAGHRCGQEADTEARYEQLWAYAKDVVGAQEIRFRWSAQDLVTLDKLPYIGPIGVGWERVLVATGYRKWGMTTSTLAAHVLADAVLERDNRYAQLVTPDRFHADPSIAAFLKENAQVALHFVVGKLRVPAHSSVDLKPGTGGVVRHRGAVVGAYRDPGGQLYVVDTTCTHLGCEVSWNPAERTWDCPCHGSRFGWDGRVIEGPATSALKQLEPVRRDAGAPHGVG